MKWPLKAREGARLAAAPRVPFAASATLGGFLALGMACTGTLGGAGSSDTTPGSGGSSGTGASTSNPGMSGGKTGTGASMSNGGTGGGGSAAQGGDPYAIPATPPAATVVSTPRVARLSRPQWSNTIRDLLQLADISDIDSTVSGDALIGFDDQADALYVTEQLRSQLFDASEKLADKVTGDATALARLVPANAPTDAAGRGKAFITAFGQKAFRRPLTDAEVTTHVALFNQGPTLYPGVDAFKAGASLVIQAMLQSPHFLYRLELGTAAKGAKTVPLSDYEVASKLSFALTNTMPDDTLLAAAAAGKLHDSASVMAQATRLADSSRGTVGLNNFNLQVYRLGTYDGIMRDASIFPDFTTATPAAMKAEVLQFLDWAFANGKGIKDFYTTPVGFVNSSLAPLYGVSGKFTAGTDMLSKVDLNPSQRSGLLTQAGFLSSYITDNEPDIIHRGVFIATRLLCIVLPPPDPKATSLVALEPNMTNRERVEKTTGKGTCGEACHATLFNPLGYAFENYDAIGEYRTMDRGKTVNAADSYTLDGKLQSFSNGVELSQLLANAKQTHTCYVQNMMSYLHGRLLVDDDQPTADYFARLSRAGQMSFRDLELAIVTSDPFLNRLP